jgi:hypothetical protein
MNIRRVVLLFALTVLCAQGKDGQWSSKTASLTPTVPRAGTGATSRTYYSYSYKSPATVTKSGTADLADYAHKGVATIDSYKSSSTYGKISSSPGVATGLNTAQSKASTAVNRLQSSPVAKAAMQAALQSALH